MIIGNGDIASQIDDRDDILFFASGVSNSSETNPNEYIREMELLIQQPTDKRIVYFSSLCIFYSNSMYANHKKHMESLIKKKFSRYTIIRIGNITWGKNPHTLINFLRNKFANGEDITIKNAERYIIDKNEFKHWLNLIPDFNCEMNITGKRMKVIDIFNDYVINHNS